jgi:hypothetical protein
MTVRGTPLYFRLLRVRYLTAAPWLVFALFEGSIALGLLLALAEIVNWWGVLVIPVAVAVMVKVNDAIAGAVREPVAHAQLRLAGVVPRRAMGWSSITRTGRPTSEIADDDAVADAAATPEGEPARFRGVAPARRPRPSPSAPEPPTPADQPMEAIATTITGPTPRDEEVRDRRVRGNQGRWS